MILQIDLRLLNNFCKHLSTTDEFKMQKNFVVSNFKKSSLFSQIFHVMSDYNCPVLQCRPMVLIGPSNSGARRGFDLRRECDVTNTVALDFKIAIMIYHSNCILTDND